MKANQVRKLLSKYDFKGKGEFLESCLIELSSWNSRDFEDLSNLLMYDKYDNIEDILEKFDDNISAARAIYFGKVKKWDDDYFYFNKDGNIVSQSKDDYYSNFEIYGYDIIMGILEYYLDSDDIEIIKDIDDLIVFIKNLLHEIVDSDEL